MELFISQLGILTFQTIIFSYQMLSFNGLDKNEI